MALASSKAIYADSDEDLSLLEDSHDQNDHHSIAMWY